MLPLCPQAQVSAGREDATQGVGWVFGARRCRIVLLLGQPAHPLSAQLGAMSPAAFASQTAYGQEGQARGLGGKLAGTGACVVSPLAGGQGQTGWPDLLRGIPLLLPAGK